jgi:hypothetical protein
LAEQDLSCGRGRETPAEHGSVLDFRDTVSGRKSHASLAARSDGDRTLSAGPSPEPEVMSSDLRCTPHEVLTGLHGEGCGAPLPGSDRESSDVSTLARKNRHQLCQWCRASTTQQLPQCAARIVLEGNGFEPSVPRCACTSDSAAVL